MGRVFGKRGPPGWADRGPKGFGSQMRPSLKPPGVDGGETDVKARRMYEWRQSYDVVIEMLHKRMRGGRRESSNVS